MTKKLYEDYLKELFGPNPTPIYVKYYNMWADEINAGSARCRDKLGGQDNISVAKNNLCYWASRLAVTPKFVSSLQKAATSECKGNTKCINMLNSVAQGHKNEMSQVKQEIQKNKKLIQQEKSGNVPIARQKMGKKLRQPKKQ